MTRLSKEEFVAECKRRRDNDLVLRGNTYPIKEEVKEAGGIWDKHEKAWLMPDQEALDARNARMEGGSSEPLTTDDVDF